MSRATKQRRALEAASAVAAELRLDYSRAVVLRDNINTIVHFDPLPIIARVSPWTLADWLKSKLEREVAVGRHLGTKGAPAIVPLTNPPPGPYYREDVGLSLWPLVAHRPADDADGPAGARALRRVHEALADFSGALPSFTEEIDDYTRRLSEQNAFPRLDRSDKAFLRQEHERTRARLDACAYETVPIHGDAHLKNLFISRDGPKWSDLEAACIGPIEWDLACMPEAAIPAYGDWDAGLERILRRLRRLSVVIWCSAIDEPTEEQQEAVDYHLGILKRQACSDERGAVL